MKKEELENIIKDILKWAKRLKPKVKTDLINCCFPEEAQKYFKIKDETEVIETDWSDFDDEEFLHEVAKDAGLSKYDYELLMDDYRNLRADEWLDILEGDIAEDTLAEFKCRFCKEDDWEDEEEENK